MTKFAERLKELRIENNLNQRDLAGKTGFTQPAIARWENGKQIPNIDTLVVFCKFFGVSSDYLLGLDD